MRDLIIILTALAYFQPIYTFKCPEASGKYPISNKPCMTYYHYCKGGIAHLTQCPASSVFIPGLGKCWVVYACLQQTTDIPDIPTIDVETTEDVIASSSSITSEVLNETTIEEQPSSSTEEKTQTPIFSTVETEELSSTQGSEEELVTTTKAPSNKPFVCPPNDGQFANPNDCYSFYMCSNGKPYLFDCPARLAYNVVLGVCDWPNNVPGC